MPTGNLPGWRQVYNDDFEIPVSSGSFSDCRSAQTVMSSGCGSLPPEVRSKLSVYPDGSKDTTKNGTYEPSQVLSIHNGMLDFDIHSADGIHMVAAVVPKVPGGAHGNGLLYGAYAIRFKAQTSPGYKFTSLLWPDSGYWPQDGEIDFPEGNLNGPIFGFMHDLGATQGGQQSAYSTSRTYAQWHTAVIEWTPSICRFILDGRIVGTSTSLIPDTPMHWVLQAETALNQAAPADNITAHIYVDWIAAYTRSSG